jgi:hypothetical protein
MTPWDGNGAAIPRYGDRGLILFLGLQAFDLFPGARIPNQRAGVNAISPYACMVSRMDWRAYVKWSFFFFVLALAFTGHLAWRFSGEEEKEYIPSLRLFPSFYPFSSPFR